MRYVLDTNVLVSALLLTDSQPQRAMSLARTRGVLLASLATLDELQDVLRRPKLQAYVKAADRAEFLRAYIECAEIIDSQTSIVACRDPRDDKFLELAVDGRATDIVSGDKDLLDLHPFRGIRIVGPAEFLNDHSSPSPPLPPHHH